MKRIDHFLNSFLPFIPYLVVFIFSLYTPVDPDLGWHLKYGEYFWQHGQVLRENTFSTTMPDYLWGNTSWFTDVISYTAYHFGGFFGLTLLGASIVTATFFFFAKGARLTLWQQTFIFPLLLYLENPINSVSFRGQQLSLLFTGVLYYLLSLYEKKPKLLWLAIPLFGIWANVHGQFILGFVLFGVWMVLYLLQKLLKDTLHKNKEEKRMQSFIKTFKKNFVSIRGEIGKLLIILLGSFLATCINPFGYTIHLEAISHIGSPLLKNIAEYLPFEFLSQVWWIQVYVGLLFLIGLTFLYFKGVLWERLPMIGGGMLLYLLSIGIRRFAWPAYYLLMPMLSLTANYFKPDSKKMTLVATTFVLTVTLIAASWARLPLTTYANFDWKAYCNNDIVQCTPQSAQYLIDHKLTDDLYTLYAWGGWLIWNYPEIKPSIDGRMHLWHENGYSAFVDYYDLEQVATDIDKSKYNVAYVPYNKPIYNRLVTLSNQKKWKQVYSDKYATIFVRNK